MGVSVVSHHKAIEQGDIKKLVATGVIWDSQSKVTIKFGLALCCITLWKKGQ